MRWAVPATSMPSAAVAKATRADVAVAASRPPRWALELQLGGHDERGVELAALGLAREAAREVDRPGEPRLPGEHVLGAAGVAGAQPERHRVAVAGEVAHERMQRQRGQLVERAVDEGDVPRRAQALGQAAPAAAQRPQRLEVVIDLDEHAGRVGGRRALRVDDDHRAGVEAQPLQQARMGDDRVGAPEHDELGAVADLAERRGARADRAQR